jgi:feruloyl esterase
MHTLGSAQHATSTPHRLKEVRGFGSNPGALRMLAHVPHDLTGAAPLVVVLHGCTQSAASYDAGAGWSELADRHGFAVLFPEQTSSNNPKTCFNWFNPGDTTRDAGEALSIRQMINRMILEHGIDRRRVFVTGLSAGGAMTSVMLATYPEVFAAGAIIAGLPYGAAQNVQQALESMFEGRGRPSPDWGDLVRHASPHRGPWPRISVWHGDHDATVKPTNAGDIVKQWLDVHKITGAPTETVVDGYPRQAWRVGKEDVIESYTIVGMAHGAPLATADADTRAGKAGPFFLDVGISSSYHIAKFFGLIGEARSEARPPKRNGARIAADEHVEFIQEEKVEVLAPDLEAAASQRAKPDHERSLDITGVITKALTAAGLIKRS